MSRQTTHELFPQANFKSEYSPFLQSVPAIRQIALEMRILTLAKLSYIPIVLNFDSEFATETWEGIIMNVRSSLRGIAAATFRWGPPKFVAALPFVFAAAFGAPQASAAAIAKGTVMVSTGHGRVTAFTQTGTVIMQLDTTTASADTTGSAFDSAGNFFVTDFEVQKVSKFDPMGVLLAASFAGPFNADPESIAFDAKGNFYVGQADGTRHILKFAPSGTLLDTFAPLVGPRGTDFTEIGADNCTLFYTSEGNLVRTFNGCTHTQGLNFNVAPLPGPAAYAHRLLLSGGMLVADTNAVIRLDATGHQIHTYTLPATGQLFALSIDPDGKSFWTAELGGGGHVFKVDIASGTILQNWPASVAANFNEVGGLSVKGEITVVPTHPHGCRGLQLPPC